MPPYSTSSTPLSIPPLALLDVKNLLQNPHRIFRVLDRMPRRAFILVNLVIIPAFVGFVAEEMDSRVLDAREVLLRRDMLQAVGFVPTGRENIK